MSEATEESLFVKITCPACSQTIECPTELIGQGVVCPTCGTGFISPKQEKPKKTRNPKWYTGLILMAAAVGVVMGAAFLAPKVMTIPLFLIGSFLGPGLFLYGLGHLIVCVAVRKRAGLQIGFWKIRTSLASLVGTLFVVALLIFFGTTFYMAQREENNRESEREWHNAATYIHEDREKDKAEFEEVKRAIRSELVAPSSAKFKDIASQKRDDNDFNIFYVRLELDSQNKYGAMIRTKWQVKLHRDQEGTNQYWIALNAKLIETSEK